MDCTTALEACRGTRTEGFNGLCSKADYRTPTRDLVLTGAISLTGLCPGKIKEGSCPWGVESSDLELTPAIVGWKLHWVPVVVRRLKATRCP